MTYIINICMRKILLILLSFLCISCASIYSQNVTLITTNYYSNFDAIYDEPTNNLNLVQTYSLWAMSTNTSSSNTWKWIGVTSIGTTNINFNSSSLPANPCLLSVTANNAALTQSDYSVPFLFDTNNFVTYTTNVIPIPIPKHVRVKSVK